MAVLGIRRREPHSLLAITQKACFFSLKGCCKFGKPAKSFATQRIEETGELPWHYHKVKARLDIHFSKDTSHCLHDSPALKIRVC